MKVKMNMDAAEVFEGEDGSTLSIYYDNKGEPFREGASFDLQQDNQQVRVFLEESETKRLRDVLLKLCPLEGE